MNIYIATSWKNQHAVEMLTELLRIDGNTVFSFVENNKGEEPGRREFNFETWIKTKEALESFIYDTSSAMVSDLIIYISPGGKDAAAELGMAFARNRLIFGLHAKGEDFGLMRKIIHKWFFSVNDLCKAVRELNESDYFNETKKSNEPGFKESLLYPDSDLFELLKETKKAISSAKGFFDSIK